MNDTAISKPSAETGCVETTRCSRCYRPAVDILEKPNELLLVADVPGAGGNDVEINYERGELRIHARVPARTPKNAHPVAQEYGVGDFVRTFQIGEGIDAARIEAQIADGVLTVHLPKAEAARQRKIAVRSN